MLSGIAFFMVVRILDSENQKEIKTPIPKPAWERKIDVSRQPALKFGIITDTHTESEEGGSGERFLEEKYKKPYEDFVNGMEKIQS